MFWFSFHFILSLGAIISIFISTGSWWIIIISYSSICNGESTVDDECSPPVPCCPMVLCQLLGIIMSDLPIVNKNSIIIIL